MSRQEVVPPVKRETGCSAVVRPTFSLGNNQTCPDWRARQKLCPNCKDKELTGRWLCGKSFATCQKGKTSCSVVVMMVAVCCCWRPTAFLPANSQFNKLLIWGTMLIPTIFERNNEGVGCIISWIVWATALLQLQLHKQIQLQNCRFEQLQIQLFCTAPSHAWTAFSNTAKGPHSHTPIKIGWEQYQLFMKMMFRILFSRIKLR